MNSRKRQQLRHHRRTDLYLVRVWTDEPEATPEGAENDGRPPCKGRVQRVVDGESYSFDNWQGLTGVLLALLTGSTPDASPAASDDDTSH